MIDLIRIELLFNKCTYWKRAKIRISFKRQFSDLGQPIIIEGLKREFNIG